jgi:hypothetical protein
VFLDSIADDAPLPTRFRMPIVRDHFPGLG